MAGVPTARGCDACRRQKKKCDQAKPACSRCARLKLPCTGSGVKRFLFKSQNPQAAGKNTKAVVVSRRNPTPASGPSNEKTLIAGNLVHILDLDDPAYDISTYGAFVVDLPRLMGSSKSLDAAIGAFVAGFSTLHNRTLSKVAALDRYVYALKTLRESMNDVCQVNSVDNLCSIYLIAICQEWLGNSSGNVNHYQMLGHLLRNAVQQSSFDYSDRPFMQTIFAVVVLESFTNPNVQIGPWFWQAFSSLSESARPLKSGGGMSFASLDIGTMGEVASYIRDPDRYLYQIRSAYALLQVEQPRLFQAVEAAAATARESASTSQQRRLGIRFHTAKAAMLTMGVVLNCIIRFYDDDPILDKEAKRYIDDIIILGQEASSNRPIAAAAIATPLTMALAVMDDYRYAEVEVLLLEYQTDFLGLDYFADVEMIKQQFKNMDMNSRRKRGLLLPGTESFEESLEMTEIDTGPGCTIL